MSGKRSMPSLWASRGAVFAAVTAVLLVAWAAVGAWMLFAPRPDRPAATPVAPASVGPVLVEDVEPEPTPEEMAAPNTDWGSVRTLAPEKPRPPRATAHPPQTDPPRTDQPRTDQPRTDPSTLQTPTGDDGGDDGGGDGGGDDHPGRGNEPKDPPGRR